MLCLLLRGFTLITVLLTKVRVNPTWWQTDRHKLQQRQLSLTADDQRPQITSHLNARQLRRKLLHNHTAICHKACYFFFRMEKCDYFLRYAQNAFSVSRFKRSWGLWESINSQAAAHFLGPVWVCDDQWLDCLLFGSGYVLISLCRFTTEIKIINVEVFLYGV